MGYRTQLSRAEDHLSGKTEYQKTLNYARSKRDTDVDLAEDDDATLKSNAAISLEVMELPPDRLPVVEREWLCMRDVARERMRWCRHFAIIQDLRHTSSPQTMYLRDPERLCICEKLGYRTNITFPEWQVMIAAFKHTYCEGCPDREPKARPS